MGQKQKRILLIDDEHDIVYVLKKGLQMKGFNVDGFTDARKAIEQFQPDAYDVVITDIKMPEMNGFEVYKKIREKDANLKVYFLSAFDSYENEIKNLSNGTNSAEFIKKPITYNDLAQKLLKANTLKQ